MLVFSGADNLIVRYIRVRPEYSSADAVENINTSNAIFDHVSVSFGGDEILSARGESEDFTIQRTIFGEGKTGSLFGDSQNPDLSKNLSFHHNVFYNVTHRLSNLHAFGRIDHYNNLAFNWKFRWSVVIGDVELNHLNNYYSQGCVTDVKGTNSFNKVFYNPAFEPELHSAGNLVMPSFLTDANADNSGLWSWRVDVTAGPYAGAIANTPLTTDYQKAAPFPLLGPPETVQSAREAFDDLVVDSGANRTLTETGQIITFQDALDTKYLADIKKGDCVDYVSSSQGSNYTQTPHYEAFRQTISTTPVATGYLDSNEDGIPDAWKLAKGFTIDEDLTSHEWPGGYVGIEGFLNEVDSQ